jgi:hypothetical protein
MYKLKSLRINSPYLEKVSPTLTENIETISDFSKDFTYDNLDWNERSSIIFGFLANNSLIL